MDILLSEKEKKLVRLTVYLLRKKLGECAKAENIHNDMLDCGNDGIREIAKIINETADLVQEPYQRKTIKQISELGLWICYKDTAYRDNFFYTLDKILSNAEAIRVMIKPYVKHPDKWTVNSWNESKKITAEEKKDKKIMQLSDAEKIFVPKLQGQQIAKILGGQVRK